MNQSVLALAAFNNELIAGGNFTTAGGTAVGYVARWNGTARAHALRQHRNERKNTEQPKGREQLNRRAGVGIEIEPAIGASRRKTRAEVGQLAG